MLDMKRQASLLAAVGCLGLSASGCASAKYTNAYLGGYTGGVGSVGNPMLYDAAAISVLLREAGPDEAENRTDLVTSRLRDAGFEPVYYPGPRVIVLRPGGKTLAVHYALRLEGKRATLAPLMAWDMGLGGAGVRPISLPGMRNDLRDISEKVAAALSN
ncbi:hypothetical protein [Brevundimonas nasdae]|uniref:DUF4136 domain-containing protein n=1 Tax=Brevundimonas nasdae TaxID=172043 RepID=A0ABX8TJW4_9CAUL|nr:hypothetical protein [Brevundimonas nasdae]QYC11512.1 hypothetical protein KWG56_05920 [Brevundimonas nasdae]QYC14300.1 hypothetical protein KWG63_01255 [Brevundimonas nasdae]